ncbi:MAG TPA: MBL fold metallo-hydrolase [Phycisphaerales bacterium]|nr:MBL fold metallo-hydrolase [Phycisphaerales bacterium]
MQALILGVSDAFTRLGYGSSCLIRTANGYVLIDCPDLIHRAMFEAGQKSGWNVDAGMIDDIVVTHLHGDHCNGLESLGFYRRFLKKRGTDAELPRLHVTKKVADRLWERLGPAMGAKMADGHEARIDDFFDVHVIEPGRKTNICGLTLDCRFTKHPIPTVGLFVEEGGRKLGWSSDTPFEAEHVEWLNQANLIVHECNRGPAHTSIEELNALPESIRKKMHLIHLPDDFDSNLTEIAMLKAGQVLNF